MIDTPGVIDAKIVKQIMDVTTMVRYALGLKSELGTILEELTRMALYAARGFNAILLVAKFGSRFTREDYGAFQLLLKFLNAEAQKYMILVLTHGDEAEYHASEEGIAVEECLDNWIDRRDDWLKTFIHDDLKDRVLLFNCRLRPDTEPEAYKKQLCKLIEVNC